MTSSDRGRALAGAGVHLIAVGFTGGLKVTLRMGSVRASLATNQGLILGLLATGLVV